MELVPAKRMNEIHQEKKNWETKNLKGDGSEIHLSIDDLSESSLLTVTTNVVVQNSTPPIYASKSKGTRESFALVIDSILILALEKAVNSLFHCEFLEQLKEWMKIAPMSLL